MHNKLIETVVWLLLALILCIGNMFVLNVLPEDAEYNMIPSQFWID